MNASIAVLMNLTPFLGFLDQIYKVDFQNFGQEGAANRNVLAHLKSIAAAYWANPIPQRRNDVNWLAHKFKTWFLRVIGTISKDPLFVGTNPFSPATKRPAEEDASDSLDKILEIADYNLGRRPQEQAALAALTLPVLTLRHACGNTGESCQTNAKMRSFAKFSASHQRLLTIDVPPYAPKAKTIADCIEHFMNGRQNQVDCALCNAALPDDVRKDPKRVIPPGREWHRIRYAPEILLIKLDRLKQMDPTKPYSVTKSVEPIVINETLDLSQYLEQDDQDANFSVRYRLDGVISHAGSGISGGHYVAHVRHHAEPARWFSLNDNFVREEKFADAIADKGKFRAHDFTPYVLAYTKIHDEVEAANGKPASGSSQKTEDSQTELPEISDLLKTPPRTKVINTEGGSEKPAATKPTATKPGPIKPAAGSKKTSQTKDTSKKTGTSISTQSPGGILSSGSFSPHELATLTTTIFAANPRIHADTRDVMLDRDTSSDPALSAQFSLALADGAIYAFVRKRGKNGIEMLECVDLASAQPVTLTPKTQMPPTPEGTSKVRGSGIRLSSKVSKDTQYPRQGPVRTGRSKSSSAESERTKTPARKPRTAKGNMGTQAPKRDPVRNRRSKSSSAETESIAVRKLTGKPRTGKSKTPYSTPRTTRSKAAKRKPKVVDLTSNEGADGGRKKGDVVDLTNDDRADDGAEKGRKKRRIG